MSGVGVDPCVGPALGVQRGSRARLRVEAFDSQRPAPHREEDVLRLAHDTRATVVTWKLTEVPRTAARRYAMRPQSGLGLRRRLFQLLHRLPASPVAHVVPA